MKWIKKNRFNILAYLFCSFAMALFTIISFSCKIFAYTTDTGEFDWNWQNVNSSYINKIYLNNNDINLYVDVYYNDIDFGEQINSTNYGYFTDDYTLSDTNWFELNVTDEDIINSLRFDTFNYTFVYNNVIRDDTFILNYFGYNMFEYKSTTTDINGNYKYVYLRENLDDLEYRITTNFNLLNNVQVDYRVYYSTLNSYIPYTKINYNNQYFIDLLEKINDSSCILYNSNNDYFLYMKNFKSYSNFLKYNFIFDLSSLFVGNTEKHCQFLDFYNLFSNISISISEYSGTPFDIVNILSSGSDFLDLDYYTQLQQDYSDLQQNYSQLQQDYSDLQSSLSSLQSQYDTLENNYNSLNQQYTNLQNQYNAYLEEYGDYFDLVELYQQYESTHSYTNQEYLALQQNYNDLQSQFLALTASNNQLQQDYNTLLNVNNYGMWAYLTGYVWDNSINLIGNIRFVGVDNLGNFVSYIKVPNKETTFFSYDDLMSNGLLEVGGILNTTTLEEFATFDSNLNYNINCLFNHLPTNSFYMRFENVNNFTIRIVDYNDREVTLYKNSDISSFTYQDIYDIDTQFGNDIYAIYITNSAYSNNDTLGQFITYNTNNDSYNLGYADARNNYRYYIDEVENQSQVINNLQNSINQLQIAYNDLNNSYTNLLNGNNFATLFFTIAETPFASFKQIWSVDFLGVNLAGFVTGILFIGILIWVVKKIF